MRHGCSQEAGFYLEANKEQLDWDYRIQYKTQPIMCVFSVNQIKCMITIIYYFYSLRSDSSVGISENILSIRVSYYDLLWYHSFLLQVRLRPPAQQRMQFRILLKGSGSLGKQAEIPPVQSRFPLLLRKTHVTAGTCTMCTSTTGTRGVGTARL